MVVRELGQLVDGMPARVGRELRVHPARHEPEERRRELAPDRVARGIAQRLELLEMRDLPHVHLLGEMPPHRLLERLVRRQRSARQRPARRERLARPLPEQRLQPSVAHLEHGREHGVGCSFRLRVVNHVHSTSRLSLVRQKRHTIRRGRRRSRCRRTLCRPGHSRRRRVGARPREGLPPQLEQLRGPGRRGRGGRRGRRPGTPRGGHARRGARALPAERGSAADGGGSRADRGAAPARRPVRRRARPRGRPLARARRARGRRRHRPPHRRRPDGSRARASADPARRGRADHDARRAPRLGRRPRHRRVRRALGANDESARRRGRRAPARARGRRRSRRPRIRPVPPDRAAGRATATTASCSPRRSAAPARRCSTTAASASSTSSRRATSWRERSRLAPGRASICGRSSATAIRR